MKINYWYNGELYLLDIKDYELNPMKMRFLQPTNNDDEVIDVLHKILKELDTSNLCSGMQIINHNYPNYQEKLSLFKYYAKKIINQFKYNEIVEELTQQHVKNLEFDEKFVAEIVNKLINLNLKLKRKNCLFGLDKNPLIYLIMRKCIFILIRKLMKL